MLVDKARARFEAAGGKVLERAPLESITVGEGSALLKLGGADPTQLSARLVLDCMGQRSPIVAQARDEI